MVTILCTWPNWPCHIPCVVPSNLDVGFDNINIFSAVNWMILLFLFIVCSILLIALCAAGLWSTWYLRALHNLFPSSTYLAYFFEMCYNLFFSSFLVLVLTIITRGLVVVVTYALPRAVKSLPLQLFRAVRSRIWAGRSLPVPRLDFCERIHLSFFPVDCLNSWQRNSFVPSLHI